jgi:hypothetical protein
MNTAILCVLMVILTFFLGWGPAWAQDYSFTYTCSDRGQVTHPDSIAGFPTFLTNTGALADTYRVVMDKDLPENWFTMACLPEFCFFDSVKLVVAAAQVETITVDIMPTGSVGAGTVTMRVRSLGDPGLTEAIPVTAITDTGVDVLIVDDDGSMDYEKYYQAALDSSGLTHGTLDRSTTAVDVEELLPFQAAIWFTGQATPVFTEHDRMAISAYLDGGGRLLVSGQNIAYALNDPISGESDSATTAWFEATFMVRYLDDHSGVLTLEGIDGNVISDGLDLSISGGDGANNQTAPDVVAPLFGTGAFAHPLFLYAGGSSVGAVTVSTGVYRIAYLAFGFEAIDNAADRALLMERIMDYFSGPTPVQTQEEMASYPQDFFLSPCYPNPFNASTAFYLSIPGPSSALVSLKIYNILGQEVRTLVDGILPGGIHAILWDGKDSQGRDLGSGVYFSRVEMGNLAQARKIVLTR